MFRYVIISIAFIVILINFAIIPSYKMRDNRFLFYVYLENNILKSRDLSKAVFLIKNTSMGKAQIAIFHGYINNYSSCNEIAEIQNKFFKEVDYYCSENYDDD